MPGPLLVSEGGRFLVSGEVGRANARKMAYFNWQWSADGGRTWNSVPPTPLASTEIPGLALLSTYSFRVSVTISKQPAGPWSDAVSLLVH
jgi:hypothetical protein